MDESAFMKINDYVKQRFQYSVILWSSFYLNYRAWVFPISVSYHFCTFWKILYSSGVRDQLRNKGGKCVFLLQDPSLFRGHYSMFCCLVCFGFTLCTMHEYIYLLGPFSHLEIDLINSCISNKSVHICDHLFHNVGILVATRENIWGQMGIKSSLVLQHRLSDIYFSSKVLNHLWQSYFQKWFKMVCKKK